MLLEYFQLFDNLTVFWWGGAKNYLLLVCRFLFSYRFGFLTLDYLGFQNIYFIYIYMYVSAMYVWVMEARNSCDWSYKQLWAV